MRIRLITVGSKMPRWIEEGWQEYHKRLPKELAVELIEIPLTTRGKNADIKRFIQQEGVAMLNKTQSTDKVITLEVTGKPWSTEQLAERLAQWQLAGQDINLMIGGPEGLAPEVCKRSDEKWSLSALTLPHPLVRVVIIEQLYRAWTILTGHPYHK
ncbi:23S rRNA (pseudouridine(1915)-N(3))-methyltransferase RlmH [Entomomonas sp. E2T0]|uniref:23S rRNA (pseudouridine(1915)-N(3))-methyltransferase RlmH n=1 Tax=Entomomonas sp. E2T0 TaxID=2930213 RepID=UPI002228494C|nr:23S rRNA (pseudouridine(1915)-N(3))-methyltransferase RlmH [Entomomonas sp. E2T0]UYZ84640.1 23S rRNA (pseudouridine(1915)-N(3))-methyltransferase RlmH [Entomomonas sp. E2T0]